MAGEGRVSYCDRGKVYRSISLPEERGPCVRLSYRARFERVSRAVQAAAERRRDRTIAQRNDPRLAFAGEPGVLFFCVVVQGVLVELREVQKLRKGHVEGGGDAVEGFDSGAVNSTLNNSGQAGRLYVR